MKWPWTKDVPHPSPVQVLAATYDKILEAERRRSDERFELLLSKYHQLKLQGYTAPEPPPPPPPAPKVDEVARAINAKAGTDRALRALMWREANAQKAAGMQDDEIIARIERGISLEEYIEAGDMTT